MAAVRGIESGQPRLTRGQIIAIVAVLAGGLALGWYGFKTAFGDGSTVATPIQTTTVTRSTYTQTATTSGNAIAQHNVKLTFGTAGRVSTINVVAGQQVQAGDPIASLDITTLQNSLAQAQSTQNSAQAKLDALLAGQTPDVIEAAKAGITDAQASAVSAQGGVTTAQTNQTTAQNSAATAANAITTAQNAVTTAQAQVQTAQSQLSTAQTAYQALLNGATPETVAVSQAGVNSAQIGLATAQENYNRLVNHTDIATRTETTALITASAAYQNALAALANAEPQAANPFDVANAELAVQTAQAQMGLADANAALAQNTLTTAQANFAALPTPVGPVATIPGTNDATICVAVGVGCAIDVEPVQPSPGATSQSQALYNSTLNTLNSASSAANGAAGSVVTANSNYQTALNNLQKLLNPLNTTDLSGLQAQSDAARQQLAVARKNFDNYITLPDLAIRPETTALNTAQSSYNTAVAQYNQTVAPPKQTDLDTAQAAIASAQAGLNSAQAAERSAEVGVNNAGIAANSAQATAAGAGAAVDTARGQVQSAQEGITAAQQKYNVTAGPPLPTDVTQAVEAVKQAQLAVQAGQTNLTGAVITAPFAGIVAAITANQGDQVTSGTAIVTLVDPTHIEIDAQVDETTYGQIAVGMPVTIAMDALPNTRLTGVISTIVPSGVTTQGVVLYPIVITPTTPGVIPPNQASASQILITLFAEPNVIVIPGSDVYRVGTNTVVDVVKNGKRVPTVVQEQVLPGQTTSTNVVITSGLQVGDQIAKPLKKSSTASGSAFGSGNPLGGGGGAPAGRGGGG